MVVASIIEDDISNIIFLNNKNTNIINNKIKCEIRSTNDHGE